VDAERVHVAAPAIDLTAPKCEPLASGAVAAWLSAAGLIAPAVSPAAVAAGLPLAHVIQDAPLPQDACVVLQVGRWDPLKDPLGVIAAMEWMPPEAHVVLAGPDPREVPDDPEGVAVLEAVVATRAAAAAERRERIHLVVSSLRSQDDNARLINALQRRADVVLQKSLEEGFGLTVTEAMAKGRAVVASAVGGIPDQIKDGHTGLLVDPTDLPAVGGAVTRLLADPALRAACGARAQIAAIRRFSLPRLVADYDRICRPTNARLPNRWSNA
jgi:trehalose synthase